MSTRSSPKVCGCKVNPEDLEEKGRAVKARPFRSGVSAVSMVGISRQILTVCFLDKGLRATYFIGSSVF